MSLIGFWVHLLALVAVLWRILAICNQWLISARRFPDALGLLGVKCLTVDVFAVRAHEI